MGPLRVSHMQETWVHAESVEFWTAHTWNIRLCETKLLCIKEVAT
jgi:hypothetical protein